MGALAHIFSLLIELPLSLFDHAPQVLGLVVISVITGAVLLWLVKKLSNQKVMARTRELMASSIYEMRLFVDSPYRILVAQLRFIDASARYLGSTLPSFMAAMIPIILLYGHLASRYEFEPLRVGESAVVVIELSPGEVGELQAIAPEGLKITAPLQVLPSEHKAFLRVEPSTEGRHQLKLKWKGGELEKLVSSMKGDRALSAERSRGLWSLVAYTTEAPIPSDAPVRSVAVLHPARDAQWLALPWWVWWLLISTVCALALRGPMGVVL